MVSMDQSCKTSSPGPAVAHATVVPAITMDCSGRPGQLSKCTVYTAKN